MNTEIMLKICMVDEDFLRFGGRQKHIYYLSKELTARGHEVTIFSPKGYLKWPGVNVRTFRGLTLRSPLEVKIMPGYWAGIKECDVVHSHGTLFSASLTRHARRFFITTHGLMCSINSGHGILGKVFHKLTTDSNLRAANKKGCIFCVSDHDLALCKKLGLNNSYYTPNGVDMEAIQSADGKSFRKKYGIEGNMVLEVARLSPVKGQLRFLRDCAEKIKRETNACFVFAGAMEDPNYIQQLKEEAKKRSLDVRILPNLSEEEIYQAYRARDVFILPSEFEGQPISILESFAAGKPVVATDVGGIRKSTGGHAILVPLWKPDEFASKVIYLLKDRNLRAKLGKKALNHAKRFTWKKVAEFVERKYMEALE